jgi:arginine N-succinyltransferase
MRLIRPIESRDLDALVALVGSGSVGLTTLPPDRESLARRIEISVASFAGTAERADEMFTFALEDLDSRRLVGVSAVVPAVGLRQAWYSYRVGLAVHASQELGVYTQTPTLFLSNDHTGQSELCSLFLDPAWRRDRNGSLLSKCRLLYVAQQRERFAAKLIAELRGVSDAQGRSPFWEGLGRHFFSMDFSRADYLTGMGRKSFVAELMPKHPLYSNLLSPEAQAAIGKTHEATVPAFRMLEEEGFRYEGYVDIFDAGPVVECAVKDVDAIAASRLYRARDGTPEGDVPWLVANTKAGAYRAMLVAGGPSADGFRVSPPVLSALGIHAGDDVRAVALGVADRHR